MRFVHCGLLLLLFAGSVFAQPPAKKQAPKKPVPAQAPVALDDMVIVITGACQTPPGEFAVRDCVRGVTRQEFEDLVASVDPNGTPESHKKLAEALGRIIILSNEAKKRGLPKDPQIRQLLRLEQMQLLANLLISRSMKQETVNLPEDEIETFYREHIGDYQSDELEKIEIPAKNVPGASPDEEKAFAETIRSRCAAGEDVAKLQSEADQRVARTASAPLDLKDQRRSMFPPEAQPLFDLKAGQCSQVVQEQKRFVVYKIIATTTIPLAEVRGAIVSTLQSAHVKSELDALKDQHAISLNGKYFGPASPTPASETKPAAPSSQSPK